MRIEGTLPVHDVAMTVDTQDRIEAVRRFLAAHPRARLQRIDGQTVKGVCSCGTPILEADTGYRYDFQNEAWRCPACAIEPEARRDHE